MPYMVTHFMDGNHTTYGEIVDGLLLVLPFYQHYWDIKADIWAQFVSLMRYRYGNQLDMDYLTVSNSEMM